MINKNSKHDLIPYKPAGKQVFKSYEEALQAAQEAEIALRGQTYITYYKDNKIDTENVHCIVAVGNANKNEPHLFLSDMAVRELKKLPTDPDGLFVNKPYPVVIQELNDLILRKSTGVDIIDLVDPEPEPNEEPDPNEEPEVVDAEG